MDEDFQAFLSAKLISEEEYEVGSLTDKATLVEAYEKQKQGVSAVQIGPENTDGGRESPLHPQNPFAHVGEFWTFTPHSGRLRQSNYSPSNYTPNTKLTLRSASADVCIYYDMITSGLTWINQGEVPARKFHTSLNGGVFQVRKGLIVVATIENVTSDLQLSNIYHSLKALQSDLPYWASYLQKHGVPTLVEAIQTDATEYNPEGFD